jgi:hypothetical protein
MLHSSLESVKNLQKAVKTWRSNAAFAMMFACLLKKRTKMRNFAHCGWDDTKLLMRSMGYNALFCFLKMVILQKK